jgi:hypothetical protein
MKRRSGSTVNLSISLGPESLALLRRRAKRVHGGNLSAAIAEAAELLRTEEARSILAAEFDRTFGPLSDETSARIAAEQRGEIPPIRRKRRRVA